MTEPINQPGRIRLSHALAKIKIYPDPLPPMVVLHLLVIFDKIVKTIKIRSKLVKMRSKRPNPSTSQAESDGPMPKLK